MNKRRICNICLTVVITAAFILLGAFVFGDSYLRFGESAKDFGLSVGYYFCALFGLDHDIVPSVTEYSSVMDWDILLPSDFEDFTSQAKSFFSLLVNGENFAGYWAKVGDVMLVLLKVVAIILPCLLILGLVIWRLYKSVETSCIVVSGFSHGASRGMDLLGGAVGVPPQRCKYRNGLSRVLLLLRVELRCSQPLCAGVQAVHRLAGHIPALPVVVHRVCLLAAVRPLAEEHCLEQTAALRGEELRLHKRAAYRIYGVRLNGKEKDDAHH